MWTALNVFKNLYNDDKEEKSICFRNFHVEIPFIINSNFSVLIILSIRFLRYPLFTAGLWNTFSISNHTKFGLNFKSG